MNVLAEMKGTTLHSYLIIFYVIVLLVLTVLNKLPILKLKHFGDMPYLRHNPKILSTSSPIENSWICL